MKFRAASQLCTKKIMMLKEGNEGSQKHMEDTVILLTLSINVGGVP